MQQQHEQHRRRRPRRHNNTVIRNINTNNNNYSKNKPIHLKVLSNLLCKNMERSRPNKDRAARKGPESKASGCSNPIL
jgi:hypothetical protein